MFKYAIVRTPCARVSEGLASAPELGRPDPIRALRQHEAYVAALKKCGVAVTVLPPDENFPDSCFVGDMAVVTPRCAILASPGAASRRGEERVLEPVLRSFYHTVEAIEPPGTLEGGDVLIAGDLILAGLSERTNAEGIRQLSAILGKYGYRCEAVPQEQAPHMKLGVSYLESNTMLLSRSFDGMERFSGFEKIHVPEAESFAANCPWVNGTVLVPEGCPAVRAAVEAAGWPVLTVDVSEFNKIDGGMGCLSLRF